MPLSRVQRRVAEIVFALAEGEGFALAGGGALIAHDIVDRTTRDIDCFGPSRDAVDQYWPAIVVALNVLREAFGVLGSLPRSSFEVGDETFEDMKTEFDSWRADLEHRSPR
jgi:hypothetical protein